VVIGCGPIASMEDACMEASKALHALGKLAMTSDVTDCLDLRDGAKLFGKNGISQVLRRLEKEGRVKMEKMKGTREGYDRQAYTLTDKGRAKLPPPPSPEPQPEAPTRAWTDPWTAREAVDNVLKLNADLQARFDGLEHVLGERDRQLAERDQQLQDEREAHQRTLARLEDDLELAEMEIEDYKKRLASQEPRCTPEQMDALIALGLPVT
jgi:DNA-binding PadR family transcriptional regulator